MAIVLSAHPSYVPVSETLKAILDKASLRCSVVTIDTRASPPGGGGGQELSDGEGPEIRSETQRAGTQLVQCRPRLIVSVGTAATALALRSVPDVPVVFCMVPNVLDRPFAAEGFSEAGRLAGVTTDVAPEEQIRWIKHLSPSIKTLGLPCGAHSRRTAEEIRAAGRREGVTVLITPVEQDQLAGAMQELDRRGCDALLMVADAEVYNAANVQRVLLWGLRSRKPVYSFSPHVVKAGAFAAAYHDPEFISEQTAAIVRKLLEGEKPSRIGLKYSQRVLKAANERTAELIGIPIRRETLEGLDVRYKRQQDPS